AGRGRARGLVRAGDAVGGGRLRGSRLRGIPLGGDRPGGRRARPALAGAAAVLPLAARVACAVLRVLLRRGAPAVGVRAEGIGGGALERQQERPLGVDEAEVEDHVVVDRLEGAQAQQRQVLPVGAERRGGVLELARGERAARGLGVLGV